MCIRCSNLACTILMGKRETLFLVRSEFESQGHNKALLYIKILDKHMQPLLWTFGFSHCAHINGMIRGQFYLSVYRDQDQKRTCKENQTDKVHTGPERNLLFSIFVTEIWFIVCRQMLKLHVGKFRPDSIFFFILTDGNIII